MTTPIDELMLRDPLKLTDPDVDKIISYFRQKRLEWKIEESKPKKAKVSSADAAKLAEDLGI